MSASPVKPAIKDSDDVLVNLKDVTRIFSSVIKTEAVKLVGRIERLEKQIQEHTQTNEELKNNLASLTLKNEESVKAMGKKETKTGDVINKNNKQQRKKQVNLKRGADTEAKQSKFDSNTTNETNQQQNKKKVVRRKRRRKIAEEKKNQLVSLDPGTNLIFSPGTSASEPNIWIYVGRAGAKEDVKGLQKLVSSSAAAVLKLGSKEECRYGKGAWSECDSKTNMRSRTLTLKKGNQTTCESTKTIQKKCKKACRYEKGTWGDCNAQSLMTRNDKLKPNSDASCEQNRQITKKCKPKSVKPTKATRRNRQ